MEEKTIEDPRDFILKHIEEGHTITGVQILEVIGQTGVKSPLLDTSVMLITRKHIAYHSQDNTDKLWARVFYVDSRHSTKVESANEWFELVSPDDPDVHVLKYIIQLQYYIPKREPHYLVMDIDGVVSAKGKATDKRTFFDVLYDTFNKTYQIIGSVNRTKRVLYMEDNILKSKPYDMEECQTDNSTKFKFKFRSPHSDGPPFEILSESGVPLRFDKKGNYVMKRKSINQTDPPCHFYIHRIDEMRVTSV